MNIAREGRIPSLDLHIENFVDNYEGTAIGSDVKNMYENGSSYETICDYLGWDYSDYESEAL